MRLPLSGWVYMQMSFLLLTFQKVLQRSRAVEDELFL